MEIRTLVNESSLRYSLDPTIIYAVIWQESKGDPHAARFEPNFYKRLVLPKTRAELSGYVPEYLPTLDTEKVMRSTSYGLMQIMGETARWFGGTRVRYLDVWLRDPAVNVELGTRYLAHLIHERARGNVIKGLRLYNGSSAYPPKIQKHIEEGNYRKLWQD